MKPFRVKPRFEEAMIYALVFCHHNLKVPYSDIFFVFADGITPLMVAATRGGGIEVIDDEESAEGNEGEGSENMIASLLVQGASLQAQTERTGWS